MNKIKELENRLASIETGKANALKHYEETMRGLEASAEALALELEQAKAEAQSRPEAAQNPAGLHTGRRQADRDLRRLGRQKLQRRRSQPEHMDPPRAPRQRFRENSELRRLLPRSDRRNPQGFRPPAGQLLLRGELKEGERHHDNL